MKKNQARKQLKNTGIYLAIRSFVSLVQHLDRPTAISLMQHLGRLVYRLDKTDRRRAIRHLTWAFGHEKPQAEIEQMARRVFVNLATCAADAIRLPQLADEGLARLVTPEGFDHLRHAFSKKGGAIALTAHFGNWELLGAWVSHQGLPIKALGANSYDPRLDRLIADLRRRAGYVNIHRGRTKQERGRTTREVIRSLKQNYIVGMLMDQDTRVDGVFTNFFGRPAHTAIGPIMLAKKFDLPLVPAFIRLKPDLTYHAIFMEPIPLNWSGDLERDLLVNAQRCSDVYEDVIRQYPDQWVWMHRRWRKKPPTL